MVSFPSSLVGFFRVPSLYALVFIQKTFCDLFLLIFFVVFFCTLLFFGLLFRNSKRKEVGGEAKGKMHGL